MQANRAGPSSDAVIPEHRGSSDQVSEQVADEEVLLEDTVTEHASFDEATTAKAKESIDEAPEACSDTTQDDPGNVSSVEAGVAQAEGFTEPNRSRRRG